MIRMKATPAIAQRDAGPSAVSGELGDELVEECDRKQEEDEADPHEEPMIRRPSGLDFAKVGTNQNHARRKSCIYDLSASCREVSAECARAADVGGIVWDSLLRASLQRA